MNKNILRFLMLLFIMLLASPCLSQKMFLVKKTGTKHNMKYFVGDNISFKYCDDGTCYKVDGKINKLNSDEMVVNYDQIYKLDKIKTVYIKRSLLRNVQLAVAGGSAAYLGFTLFRDTFNPEGERFRPVDYAVPSGLLGVSLGTWSLNKQRYHLYKKEKYSYEVLDFNFNAIETSR
ncbi:MAG: hypothetical protein PHR20_02060 [Bacteroidales bacterium]|nr:hypothetical protein [Bacteroidales bacterium]